VEYQREGYDMFGAMMDGIKEESVGNLFNLQVQIEQNPIVEETASDDGATPGVPAVTGAAAAVDTPQQASRPGALATPAASAAPAAPAAPAPGVPGPRPAGAHARRSPVGGQGGQGTQGTQGGQGTQRTQGTQRNQGAQRGQRGQRSSGGAAAEGTQGSRPGGAHARPAADQSAAVPAGLTPRRTQQLQYSAPSVDGGAHVETSRGPTAGDDYAHVGRNDPCPCGSGRKFKRCHGDPRMRADG
jgi:preprotein translocase subunit SecA